VLVAVYIATVLVPVGPWYDMSLTETDHSSTTAADAGVTPTTAPDSGKSPHCTINVTARKQKNID